ncbi:hypothetical protein DL546_002695 [Coniochaeta pulveracea]|uniref:RING-type domain-containing protein n=1 Tax=Coniochaeta pulveracea TaxID=177199 RepID=A0A420XZY8_9PEZI|nr:hypothetical protein DL546_002695 [Coniochaeta pulveracea]
MASTAISATQAEIINSLTQDEIPAKLRCAMCSKLAVNAFRLPCCEQAICENCQSSLPSSCPVCEHSPISADDCTPLKSLRTTIKVFLRTEEKKREAGRPKEATPATPVQADQTPQLPTSASEVLGQGAEKNDLVQKGEESAPQPGQQQIVEDRVSGNVDNASIDPDHQETDIAAKPSSTESADGHGPLKEDVEVLAGDEKPGKDKEGDGDVEDISGDQPNQVTAEVGTNGVTGFPNANMNFGPGNFDQMQMMMAMQNGMGPNAFGGFPLMGMPGMPMDPMAMQNMYMSGGFGAQGMGMNGMNMGMGGMNNWNNGQSWNVGPDNMNYPNASGMGTGDFGSFNSGFQTGYNQGNHGPGFNNYRQNQYGFRGRGRGRGAYGQFGYNSRGGYNQGAGYGHSSYQEQSNYMAGQQQATNGQSLENGTEGTQDTLENGEAKSNGVNVDEFGRELRVQETTEGADGQAIEDKNATAPEQQQDGTNGHASHENPSYDASHENGTSHVFDGPHNGNLGMGAYDVSFSNMNGHPGVPGFTGPPINRAPSQGYGSRSGSLQPTSTPAPDVPLNAPKGPKALLRGLPNTSILHLKARGLAVDDQPNGQNHSNKNGHNGVHSGNNSPAGYSKNSHYHDYDRGKDHADRDYNERDDGHYDRGRSRSPTVRSRSRSRSRDRKDKDSHRSSRRRRHRSQSVVSDRDEDRNDDSRSSKRHRSSRKHRDDVDDVEAKASSPKDDGPAGEENDEDDKRSSHHRSSRRDREGEKRSSRDKERDSYRDRDRDRDRGHDRDRDRDRHRDTKSHRSSHRERDYDRHSSHRDRDRDRERERDKDKDRDRKDKDRHRRSDRDREHRHRGSKRTSAEPEDPTTTKDEFNPPSGPSGSSSRGLEIKGASSRSRQDAEIERRRSSVTTGPGSLDPHAAERAARDRERLLEQTRRLASLGVKRGRSDDAADDSSRRSSRRKGRRGEVVSAEDEEERMRRLEAEREAARFRDD